MKTYAVIVAGGSGTRMGGQVPKQFRLLLGKQVIWHTVHAYIKAIEKIEIILVLPESQLHHGEVLKREFSYVPIQITAGGAHRFESVKRGLSLIQEESVVLVHDAVRCLVTGDLIRLCRKEAREHGHAVPALVSTDSVRLETGDTNERIDRSRVRLVQTPQAFLYSVIKPAFDCAYEEGFTDEASVLERTGVKIRLVKGETTNIKITRPMDLLIAEEILRERAAAGHSI